MGVIDIRDSDGSAEVIETAGWTGRVSLDTDHPDGPRIVVSTDAPFRSLVVQSDSEADPDSDDSPLSATRLLLAPAFIATVYAVLGFTAGHSLFDPGMSRFDPLVTYGLLIPLFVVAVAGTRQLLVEADRARTTAVDWNPNPWIYIVPGSLVLVAGGASRLGPVTLGLPFVTALVGVIVVAALSSSIIAGPLYVGHRWLVPDDR